MILKNLISGLALAAAAFGAAHAASVTINAGGSSLAAPTYIAEFNLYTAANPSVLFSFEAVGSGGGQKAFLNNDIAQYEAPNVTSGTLVYGTIQGTTVHIGASDATIGLNTATSGDVNGLSSAASGSYQSAINTSGSSTDGPLIQLPTFGVPVTIAYDRTNTLTLTDTQLCGVLSGKITDWHTLVSSVKAGTNIKVVYRSDSSGTTFLLTQHMTKFCTTGNSSFASYPIPVTKTFASLFTTVPSNFVPESGSQAVASTAVATPNAITYLSPDYTSIAPHSANTTTLKVAHIINSHNGVSYTPTVSATETALQNPGTTGANLTPPGPTNGGKTAAMNPENWVPAVPDPIVGYPIVGYTTMDVSSCYADKTGVGAAIIGFLTNQYSNATYKSVITTNGFSALVNTAASKYITAVKDTFLGNTYGYGLDIDDATTCGSYAGR